MNAATRPQADPAGKPDGDVSAMYQLWNHDPAAAGDAATAVAAALVEAVEANVIDPQSPLADRISTAVDRF